VLRRHEPSYSVSCVVILWRLAAFFFNQLLPDLLPYPMGCRGRSVSCKLVVGGAPLVDGAEEGFSIEVAEAEDLSMWVVQARVFRQ
jgi:hypothetical protein